MVDATSGLYCSVRGELEARVRGVGPGWLKFNHVA